MLYVVVKFSSKFFSLVYVYTSFIATCTANKDEYMFTSMTTRKQSQSVSRPIYRATWHYRQLQAVELQR